MNDIGPGLIITAIGMGLVFAAIIFLWGLMAFMVRTDARFAPKITSVVSEDQISETEPSVPLNKQKAAVAALAVALAQDVARKSTASTSAPGMDNSWLSIQRAQVLQEKSRMYTRHPSRRS